MVQTNEKWWDVAKMLQYVDSQQEFQNYHTHLDKYTSWESFNMWHPTRNMLFWARFYMYSAMFKFHYKIPANFTFLKPGLETKFALEEAEKSGAKTYFMGPELDQKSWGRLIHETRMNVPHYIYKRLAYQGNVFWNFEREETYQKLSNSEPSQFAEKVLDQNLINWYIQSMDIFFPKFKRIFVDQKDEDLFTMIDRCPEQKIVVVVNQWHMEGIEHNWAHRYGQLPRSVHFPEGVNPIGDMNLRNGLF